jgi:hypothetical protein
MTREEAVFRANLKYGCGYVLVCMGLLTLVCLILWDPMLWTFLGITLVALWLRKKIWG